MEEAGRTPDLMFLVHLSYCMDSSVNLFAENPNEEY